MSDRCQLYVIYNEHNTSCVAKYLCEMRIQSVIKFCATIITSVYNSRQKAIIALLYPVIK